LKANHQLESRMREIRQSGSEGGATWPSSLPYLETFRNLRDFLWPLWPLCESFL